MVFRTMALGTASLVDPSLVTCLFGFGQLSGKINKVSCVNLPLIVQVDNKLYSHLLMCTIIVNFCNLKYSHLHLYSC